MAHHKIVAKIASQIADFLSDKKLKINKTQIIAMAVIHDIGKIQIPRELSESGSLHEKTGFEFAKKLGISEDLADICVLHANNEYESLDLEVLSVILADKLWKGQRIDKLEKQMIQKVAILAQSDYWEIFAEFDSFFEEIADKGYERILSMPSIQPT